MKKALISIDYYQRLSERVFYNPENGEFKWSKLDKYANKSTNIGDIAGTIDNGYRRIYTTVNGKSKAVKASRLAWYICYGYTDMLIDHINRDRLDDRIENLREIDHKGNVENTGIQSNNKSGYRGVYFCNTWNRYKAQISHNGKQYSLGTFICPEKASRVYEAKRKELFKYGN